MSLIAIKHRSKRALKPLFLFFSFIFLFSCFVGYGSYRYTASQEREAIAKVHDDDIPRDEYQQAYRRYASWFRGQGGLDTQFMIARISFDGLVDEYTKQRAARAMGLGINDREVNAAISQEVDTQLKQIGQGLTGPELEEEKDRLLALPENSVDERRRQMLSQRLDDKLKAEARPVQLQVSQVLIKSDKRGRKQALELAQQAYTKASASGANFASIAQTMSDDAATKAKGGDLGWLDVEQTPTMATPASRAPELLTTAYRMKNGQVSPPFPTADGYVVLKVTGEKPYVSTKKDPKDQKADTDAYKDRVGQTIVTGYHALLQRDADIKPLTPFIKGLLAEKEVGPGGNLTESTPEGKAKLQEAIRNYEQAAATDGAQMGPAFDYHLGQLYGKLGQYDKAIAAYQKAVARANASEVRMALGEAFEKSGKKEEAVNQYIEASKVAYNSPGIHAQLADLFKKLGRPDLAKAEDKKNQKELAEAQERRKAQEAQQKRMIEEQKKAAEAKAAAAKAAEAAKSAPSAPKPADGAAKPGAVSDTPSVTVTTPAARNKPGLELKTTPAATGSAPPAKPATPATGAKPVGKPD